MHTKYKLHRKIPDIFIQNNLQNEENKERKLETQNQFECAVIYKPPTDSLEMLNCSIHQGFTELAHPSLCQAHMPAAESLPLMMHCFPTTAYLTTILSKPS